MKSNILNTLVVLLVLTVLFTAPVALRHLPSLPRHGGGEEGSTAFGGWSWAQKEAPTQPAEAGGAPSRADDETGGDSMHASEDWALILVSKAHPLEGELAVALDTVEGCQFDARAAGQLQGLMDAAADDGIDLMIYSSYRSFERSSIIYDAKVRELAGAGYSEERARQEAARWIAPPGTSEHNTGLAVDIASPDYYKQYGQELETAFEDFPAFTWLMEHCAEHGFILRYPADKEEVTGIHYEPWHYRYVGVGAAREIMARGITLEEYLQER